MNDTKTGRAEAGRAVGIALAVPVVAWALLVVTIDFDMGGAWYALGLVVVPVVVVGVLTTRTMARRWARDRGALLDGEVLGLLHRHLLRTRLARTLGVTLSFAGPTMVSSYYNLHVEEFRATWERWQELHSTGVGWALAALGYLVGSVWAEWAKPHRASPAALAVLDHRRPVDLLDVGLARVFGVYAAVALLASVAVVAVQLPKPGPSWPPFVDVAVPLLTVALAGAAATWTARRPQRAADDADLAYDELTRTATVNALVGSSVAVLGTYTLTVLTAVWTFSSWAALVGFVYMALGVGTWIGSGTSLVFRTRRIDGLRAAS